MKGKCGMPGVPSPALGLAAFAVDARFQPGIRLRIFRKEPGKRRARLPKFFHPAERHAKLQQAVGRFAAFRIPLIALGKGESGILIALPDIVGLAQPVLGVTGQLVLWVLPDERSQRLFGAGEILLLQHQRQGVVVLRLRCALWQYGGGPPAVLPQGTPQSQYDYALSLMLKQQDFARAEQALRAFVRQHPQDKLTGNAQYWLGETYYVRQSYQDAAFAFAEGYQRYPKSGKAPDSLLKLGMSLSRMEKLREACTAFSRFLSKYPKANARLKARIDRERRQAKCR